MYGSPKKLKNRGWNMSLVADVFHITKTNIIKYLLERKYPLFSWVM